MDAIVLDRLNTAYNHLKISRIFRTQEEAAQMLGLARTNLSATLNGANSRLTPNFLQKFCDTFDTISYQWLLTGEGEMLRDVPSAESITVPTSETEAGEILTDANSLKHYYELDVTASNIEDLSNNEHGQPYRRLFIPGYEGCVGFNVTGESMLPLARPGDIAAIEPKPVQLIINGEVYLVVTRDGQRMVKRLMMLPSTDADETAILRCFSDNKDVAWYAPFDISAEMVHRVYRVKGFISVLNLA